MKKGYLAFLIVALIVISGFGVIQAKTNKYRNINKLSQNIPQHNLAIPTTKTPMGFLEGTWVVQCPSGHRDYVGGITRNHDCETCDRKAVTEGGAIVVCPNGHTSGVGGVTRHHQCPQCRQECRRD